MDIFIRTPLCFVWNCLLEPPTHPSRCNADLLRRFYRDALLHTTVVMCGCLRYCHRPVSLTTLLLWPLSLTRHFCLLCCSLDAFCFSHPSLQTRETVCVKITTQSPTISPWSMSLGSYFFHVLTFGLKNIWTYWPRLYAFINLVAATWLAD